MKKLLLLSVLCCPFAGSSQGCGNTFEGTACLKITIPADSTNVWQIGVPSKTLFTSAASPPNAILTHTAATYPPKNTSSFTFSIKVERSFYYINALRWKQKLDLETGKDAAIIEFSKDKGTTWENAHNNPKVHQYYGFTPDQKDTVNGEFCFSGVDTTWRDMWFCFRNYNSNLPSGTDTVLIKFTLKSDSVDTQQEGWLIDNLSMTNTFSHPVADFSQLQEIVVYPNTTTGILNIVHKKNELVHPITDIILMDSNGHILQRYGPNYAKVVIDISRYPNGQYFLKVNNTKGTKAFKVLLQKD